MSVRNVLFLVFFFIPITSDGGGLHTRALQSGSIRQLPQTVCQKCGGKAELTGARREERTQRFLRTENSKVSVSHTATDAVKRNPGGQRPPPLLGGRKCELSTVTSDPGNFSWETGVTP